jgi:hypothetical protein
MRITLVILSGSVAMMLLLPLLGVLADAAWTVVVTAAAAASAATGSFSAAAVTLTGETDRLVGMAVYARLVLVPVSVEHPESGLPAARTRPAPIGPSLLATASRRRWGRDPSRSATVGNSRSHGCAGAAAPRIAKRREPARRGRFSWVRRQGLEPRTCRLRVRSKASTAHHVRPGNPL